MIHAADKNYVQGILCNDLTTVSEIYNKFFPKIKSYVLNKNGILEDAQDVFQEALIIIFRKARETNFELRSSFYSFLYGICKNLWLQKSTYLKKRGKLVELIPDIPTEMHDSEAQHEHQQYLLYQKHFNTLSEDNKTILKMYAQNYSDKEIANAMNFDSYGYIRIKKMRAKKELITLIQKDPLFHEHKTLD